MGHVAPGKALHGVPPPPLVEAPELEELALVTAGIEAPDEEPTLDAAPLAVEVDPPPEEAPAASTEPPHATSARQLKDNRLGVLMVTERRLAYRSHAHPTAARGEARRRASNVEAEVHYIPIFYNVILPFGANFSFCTSIYITSSIK